MDDLRSWWEVPSIAHFCSLFRNAFDLTDFDIEDLENGLIESLTEEGSAFLIDLLCRLLNGCYSRTDISVTNFDLYVKDIIKYKWDGTDNPIREKTEFKALTLRERVDLIYAVCETRVDADDVTEQLKGFEGDSMRVEPLGKDKEGALYWYFYGTRLYVEDPEKKKEMTKEEKRARDRERRIEAKRKKQEEKKQRKEEKRKLKALRKVERKKKLEEAAKQKAEETNTRRSGRLRQKKIEILESESSDTTSSSSEEEDTEYSSQEEQEEEETVQSKQNNKGKGQQKKTPAKKNNRKSSSKVEEEEEIENTQKRGGKKKTPAKTTAKKNSKNPESVKETTKGSRSSNRLTAAAEKTPSKGTSKSTPLSNTRQSSRSCKKLETPSLPSPYNSETEEENDYDVDSGHESGGSERSEISKVSVRSSVSRPSVQLEGRSSRRPTAMVHIRRDLSGGADYDEEEDERQDDEKDEQEERDRDKDKEDGEDETKKMDIKTGKDKDIGKAGLGEQKNRVNAEQSGMKTEPSENTDVVDGKSTAEIKEEDNVKKENEIKTENDIKDETEIKSEDVKLELKEENDVESKEGIKIEEKDRENVEKLEVSNCQENVKKETEESESEVKSMKDNKMETDVREEKGEKLKVEENEDKGEHMIGENCDDREDNNEDETSCKRVLRKRETEEVKKENPPPKENWKNISLTLDRPAEAPKPSESSTRWHLVCETMTDWINLAEWFKESSVKSEKALSKLIREDFLPVLPEIFEAREKEKMKRLQQEQELRRSNRLTIKMREKMEQERILAEALAEEEKARIRAEEEKKLKDEQMKLEEENKQREERRIAREERARRLRLREERAQLLAEGKEIPPEMIYTGTQKYKDDEDSDDSRCDLKEEEDYQALMKVVSAMKYHKDCWPFLEPVTDEQAPGYSDVIKRPMDMSKIEEKLENKEYRSTRHFLLDFRLMFNNCKRFNGPESEFSECARSMEQMLKKYMKRFVSDEPTDKYYEDEDFVVHGSRAGPKGEKRYRPKRAASSRAIETVHKALYSDDEEESTDEEDIVPKKKPRAEQGNSPFKTQSHHTLLLQEMIELKRQREKKLAASALHNHQVITRGAERISIPNQKGGGVMIIPKSEMDPTGVLRMEATREIRRKVNPAFAGSSPAITLQRPGIQNLGSHNNEATVNITKKEPGLSIIDQTTPGSKQPKTIRIVASNFNGQPSVKQTAESVKISSDGYLVIGGKNSGIKVTENTKIVIQPPNAPASSTQGSSQAVGKEVLIKKLPTPSGLKTLPGLTLSGLPNPSATANINNSSVSSDTVQPVDSNLTLSLQGIGQPQLAQSQIPSTVNPVAGSTVVNQRGQVSGAVAQPVGQQGTSLQGLLKQSAVSSTMNEQQIANLQGIVRQLVASKTPLSPEVAKKLDIAQRILLLNQQKRKLLEQRHQQNQQQQQQQQQQLQQQDAMASAATPAKIVRLSAEPTAGPSNTGAIEQRLQGSSGMIENQLGSVSKNVLGNVNISADILDSYYSVMNEAKAAAVAKTTVNATSVTSSINQSSALAPGSFNVISEQNIQTTPSTAGNLPQVNVNLVTLQNTENIQRTLAQGQQLVTAAGTLNPKPVQSQGTMSEVTRQIYTLLSKSGSSGIVEALARAQLLKQTSQNLQKQTSSDQTMSAQAQLPVVSNVSETDMIPNPMTSNQSGLQLLTTNCTVNSVIQPGLQILSNSTQGCTTQGVRLSTSSVPSSVCVVANVIQTTSQTTQNPTVNSIQYSPSVMQSTVMTDQNNVGGSDTQNVNRIDQDQPLRSEDSSCTILDLLNTPKGSEKAPLQMEVSPIEALLSNSTPKSETEGSILKARLCQSMANSSPQMQPNSVSVTVASVSPEKNNRANIFDSFGTNPQVLATIPDKTILSNTPEATSSVFEGDLTSEQRQMLKGVRIPANSTLNFGSPLKTMSIMEALKSKLNMIKPDSQVMNMGAEAAGASPKDNEQYPPPAGVTGNAQVVSQSGKGAGNVSQLSTSVQLANFTTALPGSQQSTYLLASGSHGLSAVQQVGQSGVTGQGHSMVKPGTQLSGTVMAVLQKAAGGIVMNPETRNAMIQHINNMLHKKHQNQPIVQTTSVANIGNQTSVHTAASTVQINNLSVLQGLTGTAQFGNQSSLNPRTTVAPAGYQGNLKVQVTENQSGLVLGGTNEMNVDSNQLNFIPRQLWEQNVSNVHGFPQKTDAPQNLPEMVSPSENTGQAQMNVATSSFQNDVFNGLSDWNFQTLNQESILNNQNPLPQQLDSQMNSCLPQMTQSGSHVTDIMASSRMTEIMASSQMAEIMADELGPIQMNADTDNTTS